MSPVSDEALLGIFVAALNVARVPAFTLVTVMVVLLPSLSGALAKQDMAAARHYISHSLRFFVILFLPASYILLAEPEQLMQLIYSEAFSGGGLVLSLLVIGAGLTSIQGILGTVLISAGEMRTATTVTFLSMLVTSIVLIILIYFIGVLGAAVAFLVTPLFGIALFSRIIWQRFGILLPQRTLINVTLAGGIMFLVDALLPGLSGLLLGLHLVGLLIYGSLLFWLGEITLQEVSTFLVWRRAERPATA